MSDNIYYKTFRPDGTDWHSGKTKPIIGEWMPEVRGTLIPCHNGYHVSRELRGLLSAASWPLRLFRVRASKDMGEYDRDGKLVTRTYKPLKELPPHMALGKNGAYLARLIEYPVIYRFIEEAPSQKWKAQEPDGIPGYLMNELVYSRFYGSVLHLFIEKEFVRTAFKQGIIEREYISPKTSARLALIAYAIKRNVPSLVSDIDRRIVEILKLDELNKYDVTEAVE